MRTHPVSSSLCTVAGNHQENYEEIIKTNQTPTFKNLPVNMNTLIKGEDMEKRTDVKITLIIVFHWSLLPTLSLRPQRREEQAVNVVKIRML